MKIILIAAGVALILLHTAAIAAEPAPALVYHPSPDETLDVETRTDIEEFLESLSPLQGEIVLTKAKATITVPQTHYFLGAEDAQTVISDAWGNPPDDTILGMIFPAGASPLDLQTWGATVTYSDDGYVSDDDANEIDYDELLRGIKTDQQTANVWREENGYDKIEVIGWAETPSYNAATHKLYWAKELTFDGQDFNTLNYDIRVLGRRGALVIRFIATMDELADIRQSTPAVLSMAQFNAGSTYAEYEAGVDKKAAYGIAGLIGGAAIAKKTGILAAILLFGKKFFVLILAGIAAAFGAVKRMFTGKD